MRHTLTLLSLCLLLALPFAAMAQDAEPITIGETVEGSLDSSQTEVHYTFEGELGRYVTITLISSNSGVDPYLRLLDEDGDVVAQDDDSAGSLNARITSFELPANGEYTIVATTLNGRGSGDFSLTIETPQVNRVEYTQEIEGQLTTAAPTVDYRFTGTEGDTVIIELTTKDNTNYDPYLYLRDADEPTSYLTYDDDSAGSRNSRIGPFSLPATGEYIITATSLSQTDQGEYTLRLSRIEQETVEIGTPIQGEITNGETLYYAFEGSAGQAVTISVDSDDAVDTRLVVRNPDGYQVASDDDSGGRIDPEITDLVLSDSGAYQVWVQPYSSSESGEFTLEIAEVELVSLDDGPQEIRVSDKQRSHVLTFEGHADEAVRLTITVAGGNIISPTITVTQSGTSVSYNNSTSVSEISFAFVVPADGTVNVQIDDYTYATNTLTVAVEHLGDE